MFAYELAAVSRIGQTHETYSLKVFIGRKLRQFSDIFHEYASNTATDIFIGKRFYVCVAQVSKEKDVTLCYFHFYTKFTLREASKVLQMLLDELSSNYDFHSTAYKQKSKSIFSNAEHFIYSSYKLVSRHISTNVKSSTSSMSLEARFLKRQQSAISNN